MAIEPSAVKYRLYGCSIPRMIRVTRVVRGLITTSWLDAETSTYSCLRAHDGVTCSGKDPTESRRRLRYVRGSMTSTDPPTPLGTYTRLGSPATVALQLPGEPPAYAYPLRDEAEEAAGQLGDSATTVV